MRHQILLIVILTSIIFLGLNDKSSLQKPLINDHYTYIAINEIKMWVSNNGDGSHDPNTGKPTTFALCGDPVAGTGWYEGHRDGQMVKPPMTDDYR